MSESFSPPPVEVQKAAQPNTAQLMQEWAEFPVEEVKTIAEEAKKAADTAEAHALLAKNEGAQSSLHYNAKGEYVPNSPEKSRVSRVLEDGSVEQLNKSKINNDAEKAQSLLGYEEKPGLEPAMVIPALREKRIAEIKAELTAIAEQHTLNKTSERVTDSVSRSRDLKNELSDLSAAARNDKTPTTSKKANTSTNNTPFAPPTLPSPDTSTFVEGGPVEAVSIAPSEAEPSEQVTSLEPISTEDDTTSVGERNLGEDIEFTKPGGKPAAKEAVAEAAEDTSGRGFDTEANREIARNNADNFDKLNYELAKKVATGDENGWDELVAKLESAVHSDANNRAIYDGSISIDERVATFKDYASRKHAELLANKGAAVPTTEPTPASNEGTGFAAPVVDAKLGALGDLASGPIEARSLTPDQLMRISEQERTPENSKKIDFALAEQARRLVEGEPLPKSSTAIELFKGKDTEVVAAVDTPEEQEKKKRGIWKKVGALALVGLAAIGLVKSSGSDKDSGLGRGPVIEQTADGSERESENSTTKIEMNGQGFTTEGTTTGAPGAIREIESDGKLVVPENISIDTWTWNVAHNLVEANPEANVSETVLIQRGIDAYNKAANRDFALKEVNGTTMIVDGTGHVVDQGEMEYINQLIINEAK